MRYGVLSDVHANPYALDPVLDALRRAGVDELLCAGDLVGYGPNPNECVDRVLASGARCVAGNHDLMAIGALPREGSSPLARDSAVWTGERLRDDVRAALGALPTRLELPDGVVVAHGSLDDPRVYVRTPAAADAQLRALDDGHPGAAVLVLGHTHAAWAYERNEGTLPFEEGAGLAWDGSRRLLLNPGSVGQARERVPWARALVVDVERREATFVALRYDVDACRRAPAAAGRPPGSCHLPPVGGVRRGARKIARLVGAAR